MNSPVLRCSGSGIYSGRSGALKVFVSETPKTEILISKVPVNLPSDGLPKFVSIPKNINETHETSSTSEPKDDQHENYFEKITTKIFGHSKRNSTEELLGAMNLGQDDLEQFSVKFLNFTTNSSQIGTVCSNYICCNYHIEVEDNGLVKGKVSYCKDIEIFCENLFIEDSQFSNKFRIFHLFQVFCFIFSQFIHTQYQYSVDNDTIKR